ncbi:hypothetical protein [Synechococcus elongatus]|uniref:Glutathione S-transferase n=1 Tax=Synechococcus elongatus PCC 11801 TaxID=2219813 RepID=A0AAN1QMX2_SYNEL|nr:hypothetical protein [Synechococcus elongatus]AZB72139.1 hypothetical protein DOP62_04840 [Synechococcus elongatus PCC 11801]
MRSQLLLAGGLILSLQSAIAAETLLDLPEEVLRQEIILDGRSPLDGRPLTPEEYTILQQRLQTDPDPVRGLNPSVRELAFFLGVLKAAKSLFPFLPLP